MDGVSSGRCQLRVAGRTESSGPSHQAEPSAGRPDFLVGDWLVQPGLVRISRGTVNVRLRPQLMDVLVCLADRAGKTVSKTEVFASVWAGQSVTESALARCIAELRQLLGDDAHQPRFIETIPKRGYRLVAPVAVPEATPAGVPRALAVADPGPAWPAVGQSPHRIADEAGHDSTVRHPWPWLAGAGFVCTLVVGLLVWQNVSAPAQANPDLVIVSVDNATGDSAFDETLQLALAIQIEQSPRLRVLSHETINDLLVKAGAVPGKPVTRAVAGEVCRAAGARQIVAGSIGVIGRSYVIGLEAVACGTGETLTRRQIEVAEKEQVLQGVERLASVVREQLVAALTVAPQPGAGQRPAP